jgi:hypothetical protein
MTVYILLHNMNLGSSKTKESMQEVSPYLLSALPGAATVDTHGNHCQYSDYTKL